MNKLKLVRITTIPQSLRGLLSGQLKFMSKYFEVIGISSPGEVLESVSENEGIRVLPVEMTRTISPFKDVKSIWKLYRIFKREKPLIVHTHTPKAGLSGMIAAKLAGVPYRLHTVAGMPLLVYNGRKRILLDLVEKVTYACATKIYPNSKGLYNIIIDNNYTTVEKLKVIGKGSSNGIDTMVFDPNVISEDEKRVLRHELNIQTSDFIFLFVGRIVKDKGINELINAFKKLNIQYPNTKLLLVGNFERHLDPLLLEVENEIESNKNILTVGFQSEVRPYFAIADVLTFPSYREGFPNVVMQACAMELTAIVTDINGCNEIIRDNENGLIIPVKNEEILYEKMLYLYLNPNENKRMAENSRKFICDNFERAFVWNEILNEYKAITNHDIKD